MDKGYLIVVSVDEFVHGPDGEVDLIHGSDGKVDLVHGYHEKVALFTATVDLVNSRNNEVHLCPRQ